MTFASVFVASLGAATALADPESIREARRQRSFTPGSKNARSISGIHTRPSRNATAQGASASDIEYFTNWSGAIVQGNGFNYVRGTFVVPTIEMPPGGDPDTLYGVAIWVGIDGDLCQSGLIQAGVIATVEDGSASYAAFYEWWPAGEQLHIFFCPSFQNHPDDSILEPVEIIDSLTVEPGDTIRVNVYGYNATAGMTLVENLTKNTHYSETFTGETDLLCFQTAEWIVEDFSIGDNLVPFADYNTATFTDCYTNEGGVSSAVIAEIIGQDNTIVSSCEDNGSDSVTCSFV